MKLVYIKWIDAFGVGADWEPIEDMLEDSPMECESVGWIAKETEHYILIVPHIHGAVVVGANRRSEESGCGDMAIPKKAILERKELDPKSETE